MSNETPLLDDQINNALRICIISGLIHQNGIIQAKPAVNEIAIRGYGQGLVAITTLLGGSGKHPYAREEQLNRKDAARILAQEGYLFAADQEATIATAIRNTDFETRAFLAEIRHQDGDPNGAAHALYPCTLFPPYSTDPEAHRALGVLRFNLGQYERAAIAFDRCLAIDPHRKDVEELRARTYRKILEQQAQRKSG